MTAQLDKKDIVNLFEALNQELGADGVSGEVYVVGGAVMCLVFNARPSTADVDALFQPAARIRQAAKKIAARLNLSEHWLNNAVKGYMSEAGDFSVYLELDHLRVLTAQPEYILAMKCLAMRIGQEFHDIDDVRFLLRLLNIPSYQAACEIIARYYPLERFPQKTLYALEDLISPDN